MKEESKQSSFRRIWKDPVGSTLISAAIIAIVTFGYDLIAAKIEKTSPGAEFISFWRMKIELWWLVLSVLLVAICVKLFRFKYDSETLQLDRDLFNRIKNDEALTEAIIDAKTHSFSNHAVPIRFFSAMHRLLEDADHPNFEFFNPKLEKLKDQLVKEIEDFDSATGHFMFGTGNIGFTSIPSEWEYDQPARLKVAKTTIQKHEDSLALAHQKFISKGRRILKV